MKPTPKPSKPKPAPKGKRVVYFMGGTWADIHSAACAFQALVPGGVTKGIIRMEWVPMHEEMP